MEKTKYYAGIGSRETPPDILKRMERCAKYLSSKEYVLRSGRAVGADRAFESGATKKEIFLARGDEPLWTHVFTEHFHPAPHNLKEYGRKLMNRNAMQILGKDGNTPVEFVVCWTKDGKFSGGTGQALRIADFFDIPIYNFYNQHEIDQLIKYLEEK